MTGGEEEFQLQLVIEGHTLFLFQNFCPLPRFCLECGNTEHSLCHEDVSKQEPTSCLLGFGFEFFPLSSADTSCGFLLLPLEATPLLAFVDKKCP